MTPARRPAAIATLVAAVAALATYALAVRLGFAYDDNLMLVSNRPIHTLGDVSDALSRPYWPQYVALYRPLTTLAFDLDATIAGGQPWFFHLMNVLWHAIASALVVRLALRWLPALAAGAAGVAFAVHPVHVEAVANVVGRSELLCGVALLGVALVASHATLRARDQLLFVALLSFAALGAKETGVVAPVVAAGACWVQWRDRPRALRLAFWSGMGVLPLLVARVVVLHAVGGDEPHIAFQSVSWWGGLQLALATLPRTLALMLAPQQPAYEYSPTGLMLAHPDPLLMSAGLLLVLAGAAAVIVVVRRPSWPAFALLFAVAALAPVSNLFLHVGVVLAERTLYSPSAGIVLLLATFAAPAFASARPMARRGALAAAGLWCAVGAGFAWRDVPVWDSTATVVRAFVQRNPDSYFGWMLLGDQRMREDDRPRALAAYRTALSLFDQDGRLVQAGAMQMLFSGDTTGAEHWLRVAVTRWPGWGRPRTAYAKLLVTLGRRDEALEVLTTGLQLEPDQRAWTRLRDSLAAPTRTPRSP